MDIEELIDREYPLDTTQLALECHVHDSRVRQLACFMREADLAMKLGHWGAWRFKKGAIDFLEKPIDAKELLDVLKHGIALSISNKESHNKQNLLLSRLKMLYRRENQILELLVSVKNNSEIATLLNISIRTVETHRNKVLKKMECSSLQILLTNPLIVSFFPKIH